MLHTCYKSLQICVLVPSYGQDTRIQNKPEKSPLVYQILVWVHFLASSFVVDLHDYIVDLLETGKYNVSETKTQKPAALTLTLTTKQSNPENVSIRAEWGPQSQKSSKLQKLIL